MTARERSEGRPVPLESVERLVRSLVGVADVKVTAGPGGRIERLLVTPEPGAPERQVILNVTSGLLAGLGVPLDPGALTLAPPEPQAAAEADAGPAQFAAGAGAPPLVGVAAAASPGEEELAAVPGEGKPAAMPGEGEPAAAPGVLPVRLSARAEPPVAAASAQVRPANAEDSAEPRVSTGTSRSYRRVAGRIVPAATPGASARAVRPQTRTAAALAALHEVMPAASGQPLLEQVELWPVEERIRCRVTLAVGPDRFYGIADTPDVPGASLELPARVTLDALRAARVPDAPIQLDGVTIADIAGRHFVLAAIQLWTGQDFAPLAGAVAVRASYEEAAARAVLQALNSRNS